MPSPAPITLSEIIRAPKQDVTCGPWMEGPVPRAKFPLVRGKLSMGRGWKWRIARFSAMGHGFSTLIAPNAEKEYYRAMLGMEASNTLKVICCHELHSDHWNWHCHLIRGNVHETHPGVLRDKNRMTAWPMFAQRECTVPFKVTEESALSIAAARFRFTVGGGFL